MSHAATPAPTETEYLLTVPVSLWNDIRHTLDQMNAIEQRGTPSDDATEEVRAQHAQATNALADSVRNICNRLLALNNVMDNVNALRADNDTLQAESRNLVRRVDDLQERLRQMESVNYVLSGQLSAGGGGPAGPRPQKMSDPEKFDGTKDKLRPFLTQLSLKLSETGSFPDEQAKLRYTIGRLEGVALEQVANKVTPAGVNFESVEALLNVLTLAFDDPDRAATASQKLRTIRQKNRDFSEYYAEFQRYAADVNWDDAALLELLKGGLSQEIQTALVYAPGPTDFLAFVSHVQGLDNRLRANRRTNPFNRQSTQQHNAPKPAPAAAPPPANPTHSNSGYTGPAPMDLSTNKKRVTPEERARRMDLGLCYYCGGAGHMSRQCPNKSPVKGAEVSLIDLGSQEESKN